MKELTAESFRKNKGRRTEASRGRSGNTLADTLAIGRTIRRTDSAYSSTKTVTNMKACGRGTSDTVRALTGVMRTASCVVSTRETGSKIGSMAEAHSSIRMGTVTTATGWLASPRGRVA
jgi:hypothetical protein